MHTYNLYKLLLLCEPHLWLLDQQQALVRVLR